MKHTAVLLAVMIPALLCAQDYLEASGQTVAFDLTAGATAAWDPGAAPVYVPRVVKGERSSFLLSGSRDDGRYLFTVSGSTLPRGTTLAVYRLDGRLVSRASMTRANIFALETCPPNGYYWMRLEADGRALALSRMLVAR
jgi:hypothetical protein